MVAMGGTATGPFGETWYGWKCQEYKDLPCRNVADRPVVAAVHRFEHRRHAALTESPN
jgi:hypothetical protein